MVIVNLTVEICAHGSVRVFPIAEPNAVVVRISTKVDDDAHENETDKCNDLDAAEPELEFAEYAYAKQVDTED